MTSGAKAFFGIYAAAVLWDMVCEDGQTLSEALARGLSDRHTRIPLALGITMTVAHIVVLAVQNKED